MSAYTAKQLKEIGANPYTYKVTNSRVYFTAEFKEMYWQSYQNGETGREILKKSGYNPDYFTQSKIDHLTRRIKQQAERGEFSEGIKQQGRSRKSPECPEMTAENMQKLWAQVQYLDQEVEFLKKLMRAEKS